jgi:hypothetical protein
MNCDGGKSRRGVHEVWCVCVHVLDSSLCFLINFELTSVTSVDVIEHGARKLGALHLPETLVYLKLGSCRRRWDASEID